jgi:hypothetical protein
MLLRSPETDPAVRYRAGDSFSDIPATLSPAKCVASCKSRWAPGRYLI